MHHLRYSLQIAFGTLSVLLCIESARAQVILTQEWSTRPTSWAYSSSTRPDIDTSSNSPSGGGSLRFTYDAGTYASSIGGGRANYGGLAGPEYYIGHWVKWSPGFVWNSVGTKIDYWWVRDKSLAKGFFPYIATRVGNNGYNITIDVGIDTTHSRNCNRTIPTFTTGRWYWFELHAKLNTVGSRNGVAEIWVDDVQCMSYTDVTFIDSPTVWRDLLHSPEWGGIGGTIPTAQHYWLDHTVISLNRIGRPGSTTASDTNSPTPPTNVQAK